jgi:uncharacterized protein YecT (DUF1311 family)
MIRGVTFGCLVVLSSLTCFLTSHAAFAEAPAPDARDIKTITACLQSFDQVSASQEAYEACVSKIADPCVKGDEGNDRKQIACFDRERAIWDKIVNDSYKTIMDGIEPEQQDKLKEMQRSWIKTRDLTCNFWYEFFQGSMAYPMIAACNNRETARRAIYLRVFVDDLSSRK